MRDIIGGYFARLYKIVVGLLCGKKHFQKIQKTSQENLSFLGHF